MIAEGKERHPAARGLLHDEGEIPIDCLSVCPVVGAFVDEKKSIAFGKHQQNASTSTVGGDRC